MQRWIAGWPDLVLDCWVAAYLLSPSLQKAVPKKKPTCSDEARQVADVNRTTSSTGGRQGA